MIVTIPDTETPIDPRVPSEPGHPAWNLALLFPRQGEWTETEFFALKNNRRVELSEGCLDFLPMASYAHQLIAQFLCALMQAWVRANRVAGIVFMAPMKVRLWHDKIREPDVVFVSAKRLENAGQVTNSADLAVEIVSEGAEDRKRDLVTKRQEYARAGIAEYWIIDPGNQIILVLTLDGDVYRPVAELRHGDSLASTVLRGFMVDVTTLFAAGEEWRVLLQSEQDSTTGTDE